MIYLFLFKPERLCLNYTHVMNVQQLMNCLVILCRNVWYYCCLFVVLFVFISLSMILEKWSVVADLPS